MTTTASLYVHTNGYDALVLIDPDNGDRLHTIGDAETCRQALTDVGDLDNWSGDMLEPTETTAIRLGDADVLVPAWCVSDGCHPIVLHTADGRSATLDRDMLAERLAFFAGA